VAYYNSLLGANRAPGVTLGPKEEAHASTHSRRVRRNVTRQTQPAHNPTSQGRRTRDIRSSQSNPNSPSSNRLNPERLRHLHLGACHNGPRSITQSLGENSEFTKALRIANKDCLGCIGVRGSAKLPKASAPDHKSRACHFNH